jgi:hypothetical protein
VTTVQESISAVAKVLEALDNESLVAQSHATSAAIASTSHAMQNAATQNAKLSTQLQVPSALPEQVQRPLGRGVPRRVCDSLRQEIEAVAR